MPDNDEMKCLVIRLDAEQLRAVWHAIAKTGDEKLRDFYEKLELAIKHNNTVEIVIS